MQEIIERIRSIDYNSIFDQAIEEKKVFILDLIRSQLLSGERADGTPIGIYSKSELGQYYVDLKFSRGLFKGDSFPSYDLYFSGEYHSSLVLNIVGKNIEIESTDPKEGKIELNTGDLGTALELSEEHLGILREELLPIIQNKIRGQLGV